MFEPTRERIHDLYAAFRKGTLDFVLNSFDDKVAFTSYAPIDVFPYLGRKHGKAAVADTMRKVHTEFEFLTYQPIFLVVEGNDASAIVMARLRQRTSGRFINLLLAHFIQFKNGRIIELREFMDSFDAVQQLLGHELVIPKSSCHALASTNGHSVS